jgi:isopenicillin N synthase-like dioxygenase
MRNKMDINILENLELTKENGKKVVESLHNTGCLIVRDPIVTEEDNNRFLDLMESYFEQESDIKLRDARPELGYQVGVTPEGKEVAKCAKSIHCKESIKNQSEENKAQMPEGPDPKWRYFWRIGEPLRDTEWSKLNSDNVIPDNFKDDWESTMNTWGEKMLKVVEKVTKLIELGIEGIENNELSNLLKGGAHLLAPTGTDISRYNKVDTIYAGYHYDISFLTIHGKSRYPGLNIWTSEGVKKEVKVPDGCLILQVGKQLEWVTGGYFKAGFHEVICKESTVKKLSENKSQWRVSSTLFAHVNSEYYLEPLKPFRNEISILMYPRIKEGEFIEKELIETELLV